MKKLGKKTHEMLETIEAYCNCTGCSCSVCSCGLTGAPDRNYTANDPHNENDNTIDNRPTYG